MGWQEAGAVGMGLGVIFGVVRLFLKPASGVLEFTSKTLYGASDAIKAWGDEVVRVPRTRVRSPRHFGMFLADAAGGSCFSLRELASFQCPLLLQPRKGQLWDSEQDPDVQRGAAQLPGARFRGP